MSMTSMHVKTICRSLTFQLSNYISRIRRFLDFDTCHLIFRALILSRLDYGNRFLGSNQSDIQKLQRIKNWAAKLICKATNYDHASLNLRELHWLPVEDRIAFTIMVFVFEEVRNDVSGK